MTAIRSTFLRRLIAADAVVCGAVGAVLALDSAALAGPTGLSPALMQPVGLFLVGYGLALAAIAIRPVLPRALVWGLVGFNLLWAIESVALIALGWAQPTLLGLGLLLGQAAAAVVVAELQFLALRRARREAAA